MAIVTRKNVGFALGTAAVAAVGVWGVKAALAWRARSAAAANIDFEHGEDAIQTKEAVETTADYAVMVEDTFIPPNIVVEEITAVRI